MYGFKTNDHQLFFPQAQGREVNYCPSLDLSAENLSARGHIPVKSEERRGVFTENKTQVSEFHNDCLVICTSLGMQ